VVCQFTTGGEENWSCILVIVDKEKEESALVGPKRIKDVFKSQRPNSWRERKKTYIRKKRELGKRVSVGRKESSDCIKKKGATAVKCQKREYDTAGKTITVSTTERKKKTGCTSPRRGKKKTIALSENKEILLPKSDLRSILWGGGGGGRLRGEFSNSYRGAQRVWSSQEA